MTHGGGVAGVHAGFIADRPARVGQCPGLLDRLLGRRVTAMRPRWVVQLEQPVCEPGGRGIRMAGAGRRRRGAQPGVALDLQPVAGGLLALELELAEGGVIHG